MLCTHKTTILCQFGLFCLQLTTISHPILIHFWWELYHVTRWEIDGHHWQATFRGCPSPPHDRFVHDQEIFATKCRSQSICCQEVQKWLVLGILLWQDCDGSSVSSHQVCQHDKYQSTYMCPSKASRCMDGVPLCQQPQLWQVWPRRSGRRQSNVQH